MSNSLFLLRIAKLFPVITRNLIVMIISLGARKAVAGGEQASRAKRGDTPLRGPEAMEISYYVFASLRSQQGFTTSGSK